MIDINKLKSNDRRTLAQAITLIESTKEENKILARELLKNILPLKNKSFRLGISGSPGVGKSTFIEHFGLYLISKNYKVAVLTIDPSSPISGGSILGDKTRMEKLANHPQAFIRPSPAAGALGGVALKTREAILLCEAAGFDFIIVETVGVGQSEYEVTNMVDFFMLMILPSGGDELQGIKKGILELAQLIIINKADGDNLNLASQTLAQYQSALNIINHQSSWKTEIFLNSSLPPNLQSNSLEKIYQLLAHYKKHSALNFNFETQRQKQNLSWYESLIKEMALNKILSNQKLNQKYNKLKDQVKAEEITPIEALYQFIDQTN